MPEDPRRSPDTVGPGGGHDRGYVGPRFRALQKRRSRRRGPVGGFSSHRSALRDRDARLRTASDWSGCYRPKRRSLARARLSRLLGIDKGSPPFWGQHSGSPPAGSHPAVRMSRVLARDRAAQSLASRGRAQVTVGDARGKGLGRGARTPGGPEGAPACPEEARAGACAVDAQRISATTGRAWPGFRSPAPFPVRRPSRSGPRGYPPGTSTV